MTDILKNLRKIKVVDSAYKELPESAGVYVYFRGDNPIYIGKAINLKRRASSYFDINLEPKTARMMSEAETLSYIKVSSELEALLLEAKLIRRYMPQYNIAAKDDKHPLYIQITKEKYPRIITFRKTDEKYGVYGPFPSSGNVRAVLKMLRRIFPFSDHKITTRACIYSHLGLCNPCPSNIEKSKDIKTKNEMRKVYLKNIRRIRSILNGNINKVKSNLVADMHIASKSENFEEAAKLRDQISRLEYITRPQMPVETYIQNPNLYEDIRQKELNQLSLIIGKFGIKIKKLKRIECYDIAHMHGASPAASMVTFINGEPDKNYYRHFRIRQKKSQSDTDSLSEVIKRRVNHLNDWGRPDLIIVDGGKPQLSVFFRILENEKIPVVGLAKRFETLVIPVQSDGTISLKEFRMPKGAGLNLVERLRDEAHRFARVYHHKLFSALLVNKH